MVVFSCSGNTTNFRVHLRTNHVTHYVEIEKLQNAEVAEKKPQHVEHLVFLSHNLAGD